MHIVLIFIWLSASPSLQKITPNKQALFLIAIPQTKPTTVFTQQKTFTKPKSVSNNTLTSKKPVPHSEASTTEIQTPTQIQTPELSTSVPPATLQRDIRALSQSLKEDYLKQEKNFRPDSKSNSENMKKFSNTLAGIVQSQTEGVVIEKKFAYDGRPVSKIKTPFGTHCIRHPKAGEKLELSPPPLPVGCGEL